MIIFEHQSSDKIILRTDTKATADVTIVEEIIEGFHMIDIPSLKIHISTKKKEDVDNLIHTTLVSFFTFWTKNQGIPKLYDHMLSLGFSIRSDENNFDEPLKRGKRITEELEVA